METAELSSRLEELKTFLIQPLCRETFVMKGVIYNYINRFWDGKCFLLRANAKKDMREVYEADFSIPLKKFWSSGHEKAKELCVDCGEAMDAKEKTSIAFMKDAADDLSQNVPWKMEMWMRFYVRPVPSSIRWCPLAFSFWETDFYS